MNVIEKILIGQKNTFQGDYNLQIGYLIEHLDRYSDEINGSTKMQASLRSAFLLSGHLNLSLCPLLNLCYFEIKDGAFYLCPTYTGLITLMMREEGINDVYAHVVDQADTFEVIYGTSRELYHKKAEYPSGTVTGAYAVYISGNGTKRFEYMPIQEILGIRELSESYQDDVKNKTNLSAWTNEFKNEMYKKTAIKRLWKYMPKNDNMLNIAKLIDQDNQVNGINFELQKHKAKVNDLNNKNTIALNQALNKLLKK